jgi:hypothetical protein
MSPQDQSAAPRDRPTYTIRLRPKPGMDSIRALRCALKYLGRQCGMIVVDIVEEPPKHG